MRQEVIQAIEALCRELFNEEVSAELTRPDERFGDFSTNVALRLGSQAGKPPREIAETMVSALRELPMIRDAEVAGPGFINMTLTDEALQKLVHETPAQTLAGQTVVAEYSDPNPFKVLHAGHLYTSVVGDAIANLLQAAGAKVHRVNFGGDVGLHVGKTLWAIRNELGGDYPEKLADVPEEDRPDWLASAYVKGTDAYEDDDSAKSEIIALNKKVYQFHHEGDRSSPLAQIYWTTRDWSYQYFDRFYARLGSGFEKYYPESETIEIGISTVRDNTGKVFEASDGAVVFKGEPHGLHTRVFINSEGLPTYEAKDVGLIMLKKRDYDFDRSVVITGNEQAQYMAVVLKAIEQFAPELSSATTHLTHGMVKLVGGEKMSSRKGNILRATDVLDAAGEAYQEATGQSNEPAVLAAVKYSFLKQRLGADIVYDPKESVNILGNSGPYLQYAHARACSILAKAESEGEGQVGWESDERMLMRKISEFSETVERATEDLLPSHICTYLYELAQTFNRFYENNRVIDDPRQAVRLQLVRAYADTLRRGLELLNIAAPERM